MALDLIRKARLGHSGYSVYLFDTGRADARGQTVMKITLKKGRKVIISLYGFRGSPMHADDSDETVRAAVGFLTLRPGDTDREYFAQYTSAQLAWAQSSDCEALQIFTEEGELR